MSKWRPCCFCGTSLGKSLEKCYNKNIQKTMAKKRKNKAKKSQKSQAVEHAAEEQSGRAADPMLGNIHAEWYFDEFAIGIAVILLVYAIWTASYLFAIIILIVA